MNRFRRFCNARIFLRGLFSVAIAAAVSGAAHQTTNAQQAEFVDNYNLQHLMQRPRVGSQLKNVKAFDANGKEFELKSLRGKVSVLVFGCLT